MYFHASYRLSPAFLHILPQHFTLVSPLERQLNNKTSSKTLKNAVFGQKILIVGP